MMPRFGELMGAVSAAPRADGDPVAGDRGRAGPHR